MGVGTKTGATKGRIRRRRAPAGGRPGLWEGRFSFVDPDAPSGRRWVSAYAASRSEVEAKLVDAMAGKQRGLDPPRGGMTLAAYLESWIDSTQHDLKRSTAIRYRGLVEDHIVPSLGRHRLTRLAPAHVNSMTASMIESGLHPRTANHARAVLRTALNDAIRQGLLVRNAAALADPRRVEERPVEPMGPEEARAILTAAAGHPIEPVVATALWTGLRIGELLALTWERIDLDARALRVAGSLARLQGENVIWTTKNRSSARSVPLAEPLRVVLEEHRRRQRERRLAAGASWDASSGNLVFTTMDGQPLIGSSVTYSFKQLLNVAGLRRRRFHDLRHGAATLWLAAGADLKTVSALLGHSTIATTANVYTAVLDSLRRDAVDRMAQLVAPRGAGPRSGGVGAA